MDNIVNVTDWLVFYRNFVSTVWKNNQYSKEEKASLIDKLLDAKIDEENSVEIINARNNLRACLFLLKLGTEQEVKTAKCK